MKLSKTSERKAQPNLLKRNHTFLTGLYMGINAISDTYLIMDGPDCAYKKIEVFEKNHDYYSWIFRRDGKHKIGATVVDVNRVINDRTDQILDLLKRVAAEDSASSLFISSEPMVMLTGIDYNMIAKIAQEGTEKPIIAIPYKSINLDWLDGYSYVLESIAEKMDLSDSKRKENTVAIVGYLFDRNEGDHIGNLNEIKRLLKEIGIDVSSIWLSGGPYEDLRKVEEASLIVSMPYAGKSAEILSKKTGAKVLDVGIPFGFTNTREWIVSIAKKFDKEDDAERLIDKEMHESVPVLEWVVPAFFQGKNYSVVADPFLAQALDVALDEIDMNLFHAVLYSTKNRIDNVKFINGDTLIYSELDDVMISKKPDYVIGNSNGRDFFDEPYTELGFPSYGTHFFSTAPYMGIKGFLLFINRMINTLKPD